ncbi:hypothetical protein ACOSQ3_017735 [Xanthoceras sorbifolium]
MWATRPLDPSGAFSWDSRKSSVESLTWPRIPYLPFSLPHYVANMVLTCVLSFLNYTSLAIVGYITVTFGVVSLSSFVILVLFAIPKIKFIRWLSLGQKGVNKYWTLFFNTLFWNLNFLDNGEVEDPQRTYPKALFSAGLLTCLAYLLPLLAVSRVVPLDQKDWINCYFANVTLFIVGKWLKICVEIGTCLTLVRLYEAQLSNCAYLILSMIDIGFLPEAFGVRSKLFDMAWMGILILTLVTLAVSYMDFANIISCVNFLYSLGMLLEFASFLWLRRKLPTLERLFRVSLELPSLVALCLVPYGLLIYVMVVANRTFYLVSAVLTIFGIFWYFFH